MMRLWPASAVEDIAAEESREQGLMIAMVTVYYLGVSGATNTELAPLNGSART